MTASSVVRGTGVAERSTWVPADSTTQTAVNTAARAVRIPVLVDTPIAPECATPGVNVE
ncbi:hypothetical protein GCM10023347_21260 [Streptomyces chumphonensis]